MAEDEADLEAVEVADKDSAEAVEDIVAIAAVLVSSVIIQVGGISWGHAGSSFSKIYNLALFSGGGNRESFGEDNGGFRSSTLPRGRRQHDDDITADQARDAGMV